MGKDTAIQWADSTVNPVMGCDGCELWGPKVKTCYAGVLHERYGGKNKGFAPTFEQVTLFPGRMNIAAGWSDLTGTDRPDKPWLNGLPRHIFVSDMSDALSAGVPFEYLKAEIIDVVSSDKGSRHVWMWLTKQPKRLAQFAGWLVLEDVAWPENLWMGTSITSQSTMSRANDLDLIESIPHKFLSIEPMFTAINLGGFPRGDEFRMAICGGASGAGALPFYLHWANELKTQCDNRGIAFFMKQLGANVRCNDDPGDYPIPLKDSHGGDWSEWPSYLRVREFPNILAGRKA